MRSACLSVSPSTSVFARTSTATTATAATHISTGDVGDGVAAAILIELPCQLVSWSLSRTSRALLFSLMHDAVDSPDRLQMNQLKGLLLEG